MATKKIVYNKLVRDKIPQILTDDPTVVEFCTSTINSDSDFKHMLSCKLLEEVEEYLESYKIEELADVFTVLAELAKLHYGTPSRYNALGRLDLECERKRTTTSGFNNRVYLEYVVKEVADDK